MLTSYGKSWLKRGAIFLLASGVVFGGVKLLKGNDTPQAPQTTTAQAEQTGVKTVTLGDGSTIQLNLETGEVVELPTAEENSAEETPAEEVPEEEAPAEDASALMAEIEALKAEIEAMKTAPAEEEAVEAVDPNAATIAEIEALKAEIEAMKAADKAAAEAAAKEAADKAAAEVAAKEAADKAAAEAAAKEAAEKAAAEAAAKEAAEKAAAEVATKEAAEKAAVEAATKEAAEKAAAEAAAKEAAAEAGIIIVDETPAQGSNPVEEVPVVTEVAEEIPVTNPTEETTVVKDETPVRVYSSSTASDPLTGVPFENLTVSDLEFTDEIENGRRVVKVVVNTIKLKLYVD